MPLTSASSIVLGCSVAVVSSGIQSLGITLQRKSHLLHLIPSTTHGQLHTHRQSYQYHHQKYKRNMWLFGFLLFIIANILGSIIQITTLPLIILSPLQSIGLIFNSILSCLLLPGEYFARKLWIGTIIISIGAFIIAYNGNIPSLPEPIPPPTVDERFYNIVIRLSQKSFLIWFIGTFVGMIVLLLINKYYLNKRIQSTQQQQSILKRDVVVFVNKYQFLKGINYGLISGALTAHTFLFAKSIIDVIIESLLNDKHHLLPIKNALPYVLLITMLLIVGLQLTAFNLGLAEISTGILYPLCFLVYNLINLINDLIFNSLLSSHRMTIIQFLWILFGLFGVLCGVVILSWDSAFTSECEQQQLQQEQQEEHEEQADIPIDENLMFLKFPYNMMSPSRKGSYIVNPKNIIDENTGLLTESASSDDSIHSMVKHYCSIGSNETNSNTLTSGHNEEREESPLTGQEDSGVVIIEDDRSGGRRRSRSMTFEQTELLKSVGNL
ncbi:uncharacterized protein J8A68_000511 [[Candida] subhashii]|uniref:Magnesium transporter n=1 Tax=[Candida] subhashii TaxID=561895 RepID=A0A8J5QT50_9ASCO|nr:uncharacterized protein J8A68_000511 [[Candida] subhashii]KAG7665888.1 hypothetical protein J8A68_000511 [[Candida] subhashii]